MPCTGWGQGALQLTARIKVLLVYETFAMDRYDVLAWSDVANLVWLARPSILIARAFRRLSGRV